MFCHECGSDHVIKKGVEETEEGRKQRYKCKECGTNNYILLVSEDEESEIKEKQGDLFKEETDRVSRLCYDNNVFVFTSAQNDTAIDRKFLESLEAYCEDRNAILKVIPMRYKNPSAYHQNDKPTWPKSVLPYLTDTQYDLSDHIKVMCNVQVQATAVNPLSGLHQLSKGKSVIIGHPQIEMTTLPVNKHKHPIVFLTTGSLSRNTNYSETKAGIKGEYAHKNAAVVVEIDEQNDKFHVRHLEWRNGCFYDLYGKYTPDGREDIDEVEALVCGDEHVMFMDEKVANATFYAPDSIQRRLKPKNIVRHDVIDCYTVSHHHKRDKFLQYHKYLNQENVLEKEMRLTCEHIVDTTPHDAKTIMVESNHHNHVTQFLNEANPDNEPWNAKLYHHLKYLMLQYIEDENEIGNPFQLWFEEEYPDDIDRVQWLTDDEPAYILDWNISNHGHLGPNGSKGSRQNISQVPEKSIIGHSHSPGIKKDCYQVGTSSRRKQGWNPGPSSWANTHGIIYPNGTVQLVFITDGDYCKEE